MPEPKKTFKYFIKKVPTKLQHLARPILADVASHYNFYAKKDKGNLLSRLANKYRSDKGTKKIFDWEGDRHLYTEIYDTYFKTLRENELCLFEIGVSAGNSLKIWYDYFPKAKIFGFDISDCSRFNNGRVTCFQGDQSKREDLERAIRQIGKPLDIIIDDGGHHMNQQQISFGTLFPHVKPGGLYFIEDLHTSYWPYNGFSVVYGNIPIDTNADKSNTTLTMIRKYLESKILSSMFMTEQETAYLNRHIADCKLYDTIVNKQGPDHLVAFLKK